MKKIIAKLILTVLRWKIIDNVKPTDPSVILFAPHTSFADGFLGKLFFWALGLKHKLIMTDKYFYWWSAPILKFFGFVPVGSKSSRNAIIDAAKAIKEDGNSILICPEGHLRAVEDWNPGVYLIAKKAECPVVFAVLDYKNKQGGLLDVMGPEEITWNGIKEKSWDLYSPIQAKHPEKFLLPK